jgi:flagellar hook assembly protein FlgD
LSAKLACGTVRLFDLLRRPMRKLLLAAAFAALVAPAAARAGDVSMRVQEVPLGSRALASSSPARNFNMLGLHWTGSGSVSYRTRTLQGRWRAWQAADADNRSGVWHDGDLDWTGASSAVQYRVHGHVSRLRSYEIWSRVLPAPLRATASAGEPSIVSRASWGANEEIVRATPVIAPVLKLAVVHHTAGTNSYTRAQSAAIVRGIELYHVKGNGWNDIGYNFLVDRFGTVYEGRGGGSDRNVIGAHAQGFNAGTVGVALVGNFVASRPTTAQQTALVRLLAWRLDIAHIDPRSKVVFTSGGNAKFRAGKVVTLRAISGHRDTGPSECPGSAAYALLPGITQRVAVTGLPKLYAPIVIGSVGGPVRFQARLSSSLPWTVTVVDSNGKTVASGRGTGAALDWTWRSNGALQGVYTWTMNAPGITVATGTLGGGVLPPPKLSLTNVAVRPGVIGPAPDGSGGATQISFTLASPSHVHGVVLDANGIAVADVLDEDAAAGDQAIQWDAAGLADGRYRLALTASIGTRQVTKSADLVVDRTLSGLEASTSAISPNGDGVDDTLSLSFSLTQDVPVRVDIAQSGVVLTTLFQGQPGLGPHTVTWDGTAAGVPLPPGRYQVVVTVTDALGDVQIPVTVTIES